MCGPTNAQKFINNDFENIHFISSSDYGGKEISLIPVERVIEKINKKFGEGKIRLLANSDHRFFYTDKEPRVSWQMKSAFRSACYTTNWCDIPKVKIK